MGKRAHGEGSVFEYPKGSRQWHAQVFVGYEDGRRRYRTKSAHSQAEALTKLAELREEVAGGVTRTTRMTVGEFLDLWLDEAVIPHKEPATVRSYAQVVRLYLKPRLGPIQLTVLEPLDVQRLINSLKRQQLAPRTVRYAYGVLHAALEAAVDWKKLLCNPARRVSLPSLVKRPETIWTKAQALAFLQVALQDRLAPLWLLYMTTGIREGEALGVRWGDLDLETATVSVIQQIQRVDGQLREKGLKRSWTRRTLALAPTLVALFVEWKCQVSPAPGQLVFQTRSGKPLSARNVIRVFKVLCAAAKVGDQPIPEIRLYDLRHCAGSFLLTDGLDLASVARLLGHRDTYVTGTVYTHALPGIDRRPAELMEALIQRARGSRETA